MKRQKFIYFLTAIILLIVGGCMDKPTDFVAPRYDVTLNFPITDTTYTINDGLKNSSVITASTNQSNLGLLYFNQSNSITSFNVGDNLKIDDFNTHFSKQIGSVKINNVPPITIGIKIEDWTTFQSGQKIIFPEISGDVNTGFPKINQFQSVTLESGTINVTLTNNLPIQTQLKGIKIQNAKNGKVVAYRPASNPVVLNPGDSSVVSFDLTGKTIEDSLLYIGTIYTPGSGGQAVQLPQGAGTTIKIEFKNLAISSVVAPLPAQKPFQKSGTVTFDDSTKLEKAVFNSGSFQLVFNNYLDLAINLKLDLPNLKKSDGTEFSTSITLNRKETNKILNISSLSGWSLETLTPGTPTNKISYTATISTDATTDARTLSKTDSISINIKFANIAFKSVEGKLKPTKFNVSKTNFDFDLGDFKNKFSFDAINFNDPSILITLNSTAQMQLELDGKILARNNTQTNTLSMDNVIINSPGKNIIDLRNYGLKNFLNGFTKSFPNHFEFSGDAIVNPNYEIGKVNMNDSLYGSVDISIPLDVGIQAGSFKDTVTVDSISVSDQDIDAIQSATLTLEITNSIPVSLIFKGAVLDAKTDAELFSLPPAGSSSDKIEIPAPTVDANGNVSAPGKNVQSIKLTGQQAKQFIHNRKLTFSLTLSTPPANNNNPVKFKNTDSISIKAYGQVVYRVNN